MFEFRVSRLVDDDEPIRRVPSDASSDAAIAGDLEGKAVDGLLRRMELRVAHGLR
jgi:hypothetical protein